MAEWNKNKVDPSVINGGQEFTTRDNLAINELNAIVNNSFYASNISETSIAKADNAVLTSKLAEEKIDAFIKTEGNSVVTINGVPQPTWSADFAESERQKGKNLFDKNNIIRDAELNSSDGGILRYSDYWVSDYMNIQGISNLYVSGTRTGGVVFCYYDAEKKYISFERLSNFVGVLTPPNNACYMRFNGKLTELDDIQVEAGTVATSYDAYQGGQIARMGNITNVEHRKVLYDKHSPDSTINLGQTSGYPIGSTINVDYSNAKKLYIYGQRAPYLTVGEVDVSSIFSSGKTYATVSSTSTEYIVAHTIELFHTKDKINFALGGFYYLDRANTTFNNEDSSSNNEIIRIEVGY